MAEQENLLMRLGAYADGELDAAARHALETEMAASGELRAELQNIRRLDGAARALIIPDCASLTHGMDRAAAAEASPVPTTAQYARTWNAVEARIAQSSPMQDALTALPATDSVTRAAQAAPTASQDKFDRAWAQIASRTALNKANSASAAASARPLSAEAVAPEAKVVPLEFHSAAKKSHWQYYWASAAAVAAMLVLTVFVREFNTPDNDDDSPSPESLSDQYQVGVRFMANQAHPMVCFYLKDKAPDSDYDDDPANDN